MCNIEWEEKDGIHYGNTEKSQFLICVRDNYLFEHNKIRLDIYSREGHAFIYTDKIDRAKEIALELYCKP